MKSHPVLKNAFSLSFLFILLLSSCNLAAQAPATSVTASDYCHFLNYAATTDEQHLYDQAMGSDPDGACIVRTGEPGSYCYDVIAGREDFPITHVNESDAAAYCDWVKLTISSTAMDACLKSNKRGFQVTPSFKNQSQMFSGESALIPESIDATEIVTSILEGIIAAALGSRLDMRPEEYHLRINENEPPPEHVTSLMRGASDEARLHQPDRAEMKDPEEEAKQPEVSDPIIEAKRRARDQGKKYRDAEDSARTAHDAKKQAAENAEFKALLENQSEEIYWTDKIELLPSSSQTPFKNEQEAQQKINAARTTWMEKQALADKKWNDVKTREAILEAMATELAETRKSLKAAKTNTNRLKATNQDNDTILTTINTYYDLAQQGETAWNDFGILTQAIEQDWLLVIEADTSAQNAKAHWLNNVLHHAATTQGNHLGNFGLGGASKEDASLLGKLWIHQHGGNSTAPTQMIRYRKTVKTYITKDGHYQYRSPAWKPDQQKWQANFERNRIPGTDPARFQYDGHLNIIGLSPP